MAVFSERVGKRLCELRRARGLTQEGLAERSGLSYKFIGEIERGKANPTLTTLVALATGLGVGVAEIIAAAEAEPADTSTYGVSPRDLQVVREALTSVATVLEKLSAPPKRGARRRKPRRG